MSRSGKGVSRLRSTKGGLFNTATLLGGPGDQGRTAEGRKGKRRERGKGGEETRGGQCPRAPTTCTSRVSSGAEGWQQPRGHQRQLGLSHGDGAAVAAAPSNQQRRVHDHQGTLLGRRPLGGGSEDGAHCEWPLTELHLRGCCHGNRGATSAQVTRTEAWGPPRPLQSSG
jgi:hypothetical protein